MPREAVIIDAIRTPVGKGKPGGALSELHPTELLAHLFKELIQRNDVDPGSVDDVIVGCVSQVGEQAATPGRVGWLAAGFPDTVAATTIDRKCGSSQQAVHFAAQGIMAGAYDIVVVGGVESMSRVIMGSARMGADLYGPSFYERYPGGLVNQGVSAELVSAKWSISREELDRFSVNSHQRAEAARASGAFEKEIVPVRAGNKLVKDDEGIRPTTNFESLSGLKPAFVAPEMKQRFPEIEWRVTAGNSSQISDGAAAMLIMSDAAAARLNKRPRARFVSFDVKGDSPLLMLTAPIPATRSILKRSGMKLADIDHYELSEAFACVPLAWQKEFDADGDRLNPCGGAIAIGHPLGASGVRLMTTMLHNLERTGGRYGLQTMCEAGGMANATLIERV